ncbi:hypothetical protein D4T97_005445 [Siminovitchia acidinfaciens]|uniref:SPOR domain-containing protein n=1 Tax=Siminovitchia acidinfaciens TaxID=2321395 RepID=A0A429Y476_9BACI|nr:hypothetical protein [Siminovitchia acidinfaciens]RST76224.1 hypothetical protein D4T97_005445 [Siminovitchia acidinfaciens]
MGRKKRQVKKEMKLKINGEEQSLKEDVVIKDWSKAQKESAAAEEKIDSDEFEWILPEKSVKDIPEFQAAPSMTESIGPEKNSKINFPKSLRNRFSPNKKGLFISTILAVAIGLGFGLFILKLVVNPESGISLTDAAPTVAPNDGKGQEAAMAATMPGLSAAVVQGGVFSTEDAAKSISDEFSSQGFPTVSVNVDEQSFLFIGIADELAMAKTWADDYETRGMDVYAKEFIIPENQIQVDSKAEAEWLKEVPALFGTLAKEAANARGSGTINEQALADAEKTLNKYEGSGKEVSVDLKKQLNDALKQLSTFSSSGDQASLTEAQQSLLNFLKSYHDASKGSSV